MKYSENEKNLIQEYKKKENYYLNLNQNLTKNIENLNEKLKNCTSNLYNEKEKNENLNEKINKLTLKINELENSNEELLLKNKNLINLNQLYEEKDKKKKLEYDQNMEKIENLWKEQYEKVSFLKHFILFSLNFIYFLYHFDLFHYFSFSLFNF